MSFIGNVPAEAYSPVAKDTFSGNGSTTDFTLSIPATTNSVEVFVENVQQEPTDAYTISGTTLSFTAAPVSGTDNIYVIHRGPAVQQVVPPAGVAIDASSVTASGNLSVTGTSTLTGNVTASGDVSIADKIVHTGDTNTAIRFPAADTVTVETGGSERARMDSSGNLLVGTTNTNPAFSNVAGTVIRNDGVIIASRTNNALDINRKDSDGAIINLRKDGSTVGTIGVENGEDININGSNGDITFSINGSLTYTMNAARIIPEIDDNNDLGDSSNRYDDVHATNGTIQTSDRNEKQDIEELTEAEQRVAVAAKGLLRKFRWKSAVEKKDNNPDSDETARIHFGIIAQDLQMAFEAEGLDAGRYAMFISSTWWEAEETYTDDEGVEQTRINTYDTEEEAPEGAVERTRLGVRYSELLAFIIGAL